MSVKTIERINPRKIYSKRIQVVKKKLPKNYKAVLIQYHPEYNTIAGAALINNVITGRTADIKLTEILEQIASGELKITIHG